jgi:hypothetical protein
MKRSALPLVRYKTELVELWRHHGSPNCRGRMKGTMRLSSYGQRIALSAIARNDHRRARLTSVRAFSASSHVNCVACVRASCGSPDLPTPAPIAPASIRFDPSSQGAGRFGCRPPNELRATRPNRN